MILLTSTSPFSKLIEQTALIAAFCYFIGFLTLRSYWSKYGIEPSGIPLIRYVSVAVLFLLLISLPLIITIIVTKYLPPLIPSFKGKEIIISIIIFGCLLSMYWLTLSLFQVENLVIFRSFQLDGWFWTEFFTWALISGFILIFDPLFKVIIAQDSIRLTLYFTLTIFWIFYLTNAFAEKLYPLIPATYGGGYPEEIKLIFQSDKVNKDIIKLFEKSLENKYCLGVGTSKSSNCETKNLVLLEETDKDYFILSKSQNSCLSGSQKDIAEFLRDNYESYRISKDFAPNVKYFNNRNRFDPTCDKNIIQTVLMFEAIDKDKDNDYVIRIYQDQDKTGDFFINLYNKKTQIIELEHEKVKKSLESVSDERYMGKSTDEFDILLKNKFPELAQLDKSKLKGIVSDQNRPQTLSDEVIKFLDKWEYRNIKGSNSYLCKNEVYTYISSQPLTLGYGKVTAMVNSDRNYAILQATTLDNSVNSNSNNTGNIENLNINGKSIVLEPGQGSNSLASQTLVDTFSLASMVSYPSTNSNKIIYEQNFKQHNLLFTQRFFPRIFPPGNLEALVVKDQVKSLDDGSIWYSLFHQANEDNKISYINGWVKVNI